MSKYIITYTEYTYSNGAPNWSKTNCIKCDTLKEVQEKLSKLQSIHKFNISNIEIYTAEEITKFVNLIKETI